MVAGIERKHEPADRSNPKVPRDLKGKGGDSDDSCYMQKQAQAMIREGLLRLWAPESLDAHLYRRKHGSKLPVIPELRELTRIHVVFSDRLVVKPWREDQECCDHNGCERACDR
jgi:hypothetical protein